MTRNAPLQGYIPFLQPKHQFVTIVYLPSPNFPPAPNQKDKKFNYYTNSIDIIQIHVKKYMKNDARLPQHAQEAAGCRWYASVSAGEVSYNETSEMHQS